MMQAKRSRAIVVALLSTLLGTGAWAQAILDARPDLEALYFINGVQSDTTAPDDIATAISCTNLGADSATIILEVYQNDSVFVSDTQSTLAPGQTTIRTTQSIPAIQGESSFGGSSDETLVIRILATKKASIRCTASLYQYYTSANPTVIPLPVLSLTKQKKLKFK